MPLHRVVENAVGAVSCVLLVVLLWSTFLRDEAPPTPASLPRLPALEGLLLITSSQQIAELLAPALPPGSSTTVHETRGFALGPGMHTLLDDDLTGAAPSLVVLQGGEGDLGAEPERVRIAVEQMIDRLRLTVGDRVDVVAVGPVPTGEAQPGLRRVRDEVAAAAARKGVAFVDPIELGADRADPTTLRLLTESLTPLLALAAAPG